MKDAENGFKDLISKNGFAIVEGTDEQLFHIYEKNDYSDFPSFVTTDMYLQLYHMYFDFLLRDLEQTKLMGELKSFATTMHSEMLKIAKSTSDPVIKDAAEYNATFYAIGLSLLTDNKNYEVPAKYKEYFEEEIGNVNKASDNFSEFLGWEDVMFPYSLFRPRGHYTRNDAFKLASCRLTCRLVFSVCNDCFSSFRLLFSAVSSPIRRLVLLSSVSSRECSAAAFADIISLVCSRSFFALFFNNTIIIAAAMPAITIPIKIPINIYARICYKDKERFKDLKIQ